MSKKETNINEKLFNLQKEIGTISKTKRIHFMVLLILTLTL